MPIELIDISICDLVLTPSEFPGSKSKVENLTSPPLTDPQFQEVSSNVTKLCALPPFGDGVGYRRIQVVMPDGIPKVLEYTQYYVDDNLRVTNIPPNSRVTIRSGRYVGGDVYTHEQVRTMD